MKRMLLLALSALVSGCAAGGGAPSPDSQALHAEVEKLRAEVDALRQASEARHGGLEHPQSPAHATAPGQRALEGLSQAQTAVGSAPSTAGRAPGVQQSPEGTSGLEPSAPGTATRTADPAGASPAGKVVGRASPQAAFQPAPGDPAPVLLSDGSLLLTLPSSASAENTPAVQGSSPSSAASYGASSPSSSVAAPLPPSRSLQAGSAAPTAKSQSAGTSKGTSGSLKTEDYGNQSTGGSAAPSGDLSSISAEDYKRLMEQVQKGREYLEERNKLIEQLNEEN